MRALLLLLFLVACATGSGAGPGVGSGPAPAPAAAPDLPLLSEDFESDTARWWLIAPDDSHGYTTEIATADAAHSGSHALHLVSPTAGVPDPTHFAVALYTIPAAGLAGRRLHLSGWIRTANVSRGRAALLLNSGSAGVSNDMSDQPVIGTTPWTQYALTLDVPVGATEVKLGAALPGDGEAWFDDLRITVSDIPPTVIVGTVKDQSGRPVPGALVALVGKADDRAAAKTHTSAGGDFAFTVAAGEYALTATAPGLTAAYFPTKRFAGPGGHADLVVGGSGFTVTGVLHGSGAPGAVIAATRVSDVEGDIFYAEPDAAGAFALRLPAARYTLAIEGDNLASLPLKIEQTTDQTVTLEATRLEPPAAEVVEWIKQHAMWLRTIEPGSSAYEDLRPLAAVIGKARVVALGEATHGTHEFYQLKERLFEYMVSELGFTVFAIEANWPECFAVNDYILTGKGKPAAALAGLYFWTWYTEESLDLIKWMRAWNADPEHRRKVRLVGFDMQTARVAVARVTEYLNRVDAPFAKATTPNLIALAGLQENTYAQDPAEVRELTAQTITAILARFDAKRDAWTRATSAAAWAEARQHAVIMRQAEHHYVTDDPTYRDQSMADNLRWLLAAYPGERVVVWAHNVHIQLDEKRMGSTLAAALGEDYLALGLVFDHGAFLANGRPPAVAGIGRFSVGPTSDRAMSFALHHTGSPFFFLDLRNLPVGAVRDWFATRRPTRETGAVFSDEAHMTPLASWNNRFHGVFFVDETTSTQVIGQPGPEKLPPRLDY